MVKPICTALFGCVRLVHYCRCGEAGRTQARSIEVTNSSQSGKWPILGRVALCAGDSGCGNTAPETLPSSDHHPLTDCIEYPFLQHVNAMLNRKSRTVQITVGKKTHTMPVVQAFNALHAASSAYKHTVSLQAMQVSVEEMYACPIVAESSPPHVMAQQALLVIKLSGDAIIPNKGSAAAA